MRSCFSTDLRAHDDRASTGPCRRVGTTIASRLPNLLRTFCLTGALLSCALGVDFDSLSNTCEPPQFDLPGSDTFCDVELIALPPQALSGLQVEAGLTTAVNVALRDGLLATATLAVAPGLNGCFRAIPGISLDRLAADGSLTRIGVLNGLDRDLTFRLGDCPEANAVYVFPTEIDILETEPVEVVATFGDGGLVQAWFSADSDDGEPFLVHHIAGDPRGPTRRHCSAGACVTALLGYCQSSAECEHDAYCDNERCRALGRCVGGCPDGQPCVGERCATRCGTSDDCPHPYNCFNRVCGGQLAQTTADSGALPPAATPVSSMHVYQPAPPRRIAHKTSVSVLT